MESLSSFAHTMRAKAMQSGHPSYLAKCSSTCRVMLAAIVLGGIVIATAGWYTLKNRKVRQQPPPEIKLNPKAPLPIEPNPPKTEKQETPLDKLKTGLPLFLFSAQRELSTELRLLSNQKGTDVYLTKIAKGYFERLELLKDYHKNGFLFVPVPYNNNTGEITLEEHIKVVKKEHRDQVSCIFNAVNKARTNNNFLYVPEPKLLKDGLPFLLRVDIYEAPEGIYEAPKVPLDPPSQQSDAQRLAGLVASPQNPLTDDVKKLAGKLLRKLPPRTDGQGYISLDGVKLYGFCGKVDNVRVALTSITNGRRLNSDRQVNYIRGFDGLMIELQTAALKARKEGEKCQEVLKKLNDFQSKWKSNLNDEAKRELHEIIQRFQLGATPRLLQETKIALNDFLEKWPKPPYSLNNDAINELREITKDIQTAAEASGAE